MLHAVLDVTPSDQVSVALPWGSAVNCRCAAHLRWFAEIPCSSAKVACTCAFAGQKYFSAHPESFFHSSINKDQVLKADVPVITTVWESISPTVALLEGPLVQELDIYGTTPSISDLKGWCERAAWIGKVWKESLTESTIQLATSMSSDLRRITPVFEHFVTDEKMNAAMVNKTLLSSKVKQPLADKAIALFHIMKLARGFKADLGASPGDEPDVEDVIDGAELALTAAKRALVVIAGCAIVYAGTDKQQAEAMKLTSTDRPDMPKLLWKALKLLATAKKENIKGEHK